MRPIAFTWTLFALPPKPVFKIETSNTSPTGVEPSITTRADTEAFYPLLRAAIFPAL
jgi:hypothetical protein